VQRGIFANRNTAFDPQHPVEGHFAVISALSRIPRRVKSDFLYECFGHVSTTSLIIPDRNAVAIPCLGYPNGSNPPSFLHRQTYVSLSFPFLVGHVP